MCDELVGRCFPPNEVGDSACRAPIDLTQGLPADFELRDSQDTAPTYTLLDPVDDGCETRQRVLVQDNCGNAQIVNLTSRRPPNPGEVNVFINGFRCFSVI